MPLVPGHSINRRYRVIRTLGHGGMGTVYLVHDTHWGDQPVALKLLRPDALDATAVELFKQEFRAMTRLRHPNLAEVYDFGSDAESGRQYLTMEYVDGKDLTSWRWPTARDAFETLAVQGLRALDYVHSRGLLHNDIKPQNILVRSPLLVKVLDFGLANPQAEPTRLGLSGTIHYIAPERFKGRLADPRSDLYSFGVVLYELLTGELPFQAEDAGRVVTAIMQGRFRAPHELNPEIPERFERFVLALLSREPQGRPASAAAALALLNEGASGAQTLDTPETRASYITSGAFVARDQELASLLATSTAHMHDPGSDRQPRLILVSGPSGIGKSRLLRELRYQLQLAGISALTGRCHEDGGVPYQPFVEVLRQLPRRDDLPPAARQALHEIDGPGSAGPADAGDDGGRGAGRDKGAFLNGLATALDALAPDVAGVIILEALQWCDGPGIDLLEHLLLRPGRGRWLLIGAMRDEAEAAAPAAALARRYASSTRVQSLPLRPLRDSEVLDLLVSMMPFEEQPGALARQLVARTGGNPLYVEELMQSLAEEGTLRRSPAGWVADSPSLESLRLPPSLAGMLAQRLEALPARERAIVEVLGVINRPAPAALVARAAGLEPIATAAAIEALDDLRLVIQETQRAGPPLVSLAHSRIREAAYGALAPERRLALHLAAARAIESTHLDALDGVVEELAHHFAAAGEQGPAVDYLLRAAAKAESLYYPHRNSDFLEQALRLMPADDARRLATLRDLAYVKARDLGDFEGSLAHGEALLEEARRRKDRLFEATGLRLIAAARSYLGESRVALDFAQRALTMARATAHDRTIMECSNTLGIVLARQGEARQALAPFEEALALAEREGLLLESCRILSNLGLTQLGLGNIDKSRDLIARLLEMSKRRGVAYWYHRSLPNYGVTLVESGDLPGGIAAVEAGIAWAREHVNFEVVSQGLSNLGVLFRLGGQHDRAVAALDEELELRRGTGDRANQPYALELAGRALRELGRIADAEDRHRRGLEISRDLKLRMQEGFLLAALADDKLAVAAYDAAADLARQAVAIGRELGHVRLTSLASCALATCLARTGDRRELNAIIRQLARVEGRQLRLYDRLRINLTLGRCALTTGKLPEAEREARAGLTVAEKSGIREFAWRFLALLGDVLAARKLPDDASHFYNAALSVIRQIAADIGDPAMRDSYEKDPERQDLVRRIPTAEEASTLPAQPGAPIPAGAPVAAQSAALPATPGLPAPIAGDRPGPLAGGKGDPLRALTALYQVSQIVNSILDLKELLNKVMDLAIEIVNAERGLIFLYRSETDEMEMVVARNMERQTIKDATEYSRSIVREASHGRSILTHDAVTDERFKDFRSVSIYHIRSLLCVPLRTRNRVVGTVYVDTRQPGVVFAPEDQQFLEAFANHAAIAIENARLYDQMRQENLYLKKAVDERYGYENIIGRSPKMREVFAMLSRISSSTLPVLIRGDSGTGKELVARAIHQNSPRRDRRFFSENCAALPDTLLESELFGHVKGAFTGADAPRKGLFELSDSGTLFLDEVGDMTPSMQSKLLRVLQDGEMRPVGAETTRHVDVRLISATSRDLEAMIGAKQFRQDLFFRLNVITLTLPALHDRRDDIPLLVDHFLTRIAQTNKTPKLRVDRELMTLLTRYDWPGNIRELENRISRLALFANGDTLTLHEANQDPDFYAKVTATTPLTRPGSRPGTQGTGMSPGGGSVTDAGGPSSDSAFGSIEPELSDADRIRQALIDARGSRDEAARRLGISRATLFRKLKQFGIQEKGSRSFRPPEQV